MLIIGCKIYRSALDLIPANAILIEDNPISWIGDASEAPPCDNIIQFEGGSIFPALTDAHVHLFMLALTRLQLSFAQPAVPNFQELIHCLEN
jgi:predicted amidohydrolase YtcJ